MGYSTPSALTATLAVLLLLLATGTVAHAQDRIQEQTQPRQHWRIQTKDGSVLQGVFLGQTEAGIRLLTESAGEITVPMEQVNSFRILDERNFKNGEYWFENPNATRYLFSPTAYSLRKGEAYYQNTYLVLNSFNYGLTDRFTIGAGFEIISTFSGEPTFFITPKYSIPISDKLNAGVGVLYATTALGEGFGGLGIGYGIVTYGNREHNATLGAGFGFVDDEVSGQPVLTLSGMTRVGRKTALVTENWFIPENSSYYGVYSYGIRFMGEKITVDLAFLNNADIAESIPIGVPYVDFVVKFGQ
ncbi:hypothetical protein CLV24_10650 [Pontibacter ummariensis]|uniref:Uncharacterized protein n=1 Tax=Pontibacter ummariensis TaxID=1610492 RepID=A0A239E8Y5_9BACT|nr:hypothetical protein [Pontibacter ummariensis]PRY13136.1 hypothetical protein CLV24_10650 [Pontibacter ummariensis]SNS40931.1 hypothetical protein SAMN06296052_10650 [Pontibacter ummariensis]